jgi:hypothetical protein
VSDLYNANVGDNPVKTSASALVAFLKHSGAATQDEVDNTMRMTSSEFKPTLTILRNSDIDKHSLDLDMAVEKKKKKKKKQRETADSDVDAEEIGVTNANVKELFKNFTVKFVNVGCVHAAEVNNVVKVLEHYRLREDDP